MSALTVFFRRTPRILDFWTIPPDDALLLERHKTTVPHSRFATLDRGLQRPEAKQRNHSISSCFIEMYSLRSRFRTKIRTCGLSKSHYSLFSHFTSKITWIFIFQLFIFCSTCSYNLLKYCWGSFSSAHATA